MHKIVLDEALVVNENNKVNLYVSFLSLSRSRTKLAAL